MRAFIKNETEADDYYVEGGILGHTVILGAGTEHEARLRVYEETMLESSRVHCDCCRCIGWHHHPVTRKQYHFIIHTDFRTDAKPELKGKRICQLCTAAMPAKEKVCASCGENDSETSFLDYQTHLMHGMLHANGCGHLMRINGREAGSRTLSGQQLIQVWEKICNLLRAREVSVEDVSQKYGVEFRLLNPVACGKTWYGTYGYQFGKGSFGNTAATHRKAAERLRGFPLELVKADFKNMMRGAAWDGEESDEEALEVIARYEMLMGTFAPKTLGDLVALLLKLQRIVRRNDKAEKELVLREQRRAGRVAGKSREDSGETSGADRAARRREEEREAAAKRKAASSLFEPLKFESKASKAKASKLRGGAGPGSGTPTRVMSSAKPRATPARPLRPRGADGLVPSSAPAPPPEVKREREAPQATRVKREPSSEPTPAAPAAKKQKGKTKAEASSPKSSTGSRWSDARIETASNACVEVLREAGGKWMPRQEVRGLARSKGVGDTGLLDHVLKSISERKVMLVKLDKHKNPTGAPVRAHIHRRQNSSTGQLEYHLDKVDGMKKMRASVVIPKSNAKPAPVVAKGKQAATTTTTSAGGGKRPSPNSERHAMEEAARQLSKKDLDRDVKAVYKSLLESYKPARPRPGRPGKPVPGGGTTKCKGADLIHCARVLLDTKQFVKTYYPVEDLLTLRPPAQTGKGGRPPMVATGLRVLVTAVIDSRNRGPKVSGMADAGAGGKSKTARRREHGVETKPPPEVVLLPPDPMLSDLKAAANKCFQDLYVVLAKFKVKTVVGFETLKDASRLGPKRVAGARVEVHGEGADLESEFRYQGGLDQWVVRCVCGTCDDDGERMIACDVCEVWMHTRCVGISDAQGTPRRWTCGECDAEAQRTAEKAKAAERAMPEPPKQPPAERVRPPPTVRRPLPERIMPRRKGSVR